MYNIIIIHGSQTLIDVKMWKCRYCFSTGRMLYSATICNRGILPNSIHFLAIICRLTCITLDNTQLKFMTTWISISYSHTTDTNTIEKCSIGTNTDSDTCIGGTLVNFIEEHVCAMETIKNPDIGPVFNYDI